MGAFAFFSAPERRFYHFPPDPVANGGKPGVSPVINGGFEGPEPSRMGEMDPLRMGETDRYEWGELEPAPRHEWGETGGKYRYEWGIFPLRKGENPGKTPCWTRQPRPLMMFRIKVVNNQTKRLHHSRPFVPRCPEVLEVLVPVDRPVRKGAIGRGGETGTGCSRTCRGLLDSRSTGASQLREFGGIEGAQQQMLSTPE